MGIETDVPNLEIESAELTHRVTSQIMLDPRTTTVLRVPYLAKPPYDKEVPSKVLEIPDLGGGRKFNGTVYDIGHPGGAFCAVSVNRQTSPDVETRELFQIEQNRIIYRLAEYDEKKDTYDEKQVLSSEDGHEAFSQIKQKLTDLMLEVGLT